jgi:polyisoprenoid-binding protein YceI
MTTTTKLSELTGDYVLDTAHTRIGFVARQAIVSKVPGHFDEFESSAYLNGEDPSQSSILLTIQAKSIQTHNDRRDAHLRRAFLDVDNHPAITFISTRVEQVDRTSFKVTGDLTIRGMTQPVTVDFDMTRTEIDPVGNFRVQLNGRTTINRNDWGVRWNAAIEGGGVIVSKKVTLELAIAAVRQS